jgi:hypothetical protein
MHSGTRELAEGGRFLPDEANESSSCLQTIAPGCTALQHSGKFPIPPLVPATRIAVDSHASQESSLRRGFCFWPPHNLSFLVGTWPRISLRQDDLPTAGSARKPSSAQQLHALSLMVSTDG